MIKVSQGRAWCVHEPGMSAHHMNLDHFDCDIINQRNRLRLFMRAGIDMKTFNYMARVLLHLMRERHAYQKEYENATRNA